MSVCLSGFDDEMRLRYTQREEEGSEEEKTMPFTHHPFCKQSFDRWFIRKDLRLDSILSLLTHTSHSHTSLSPHTVSTHSTSVRHMPHLIFHLLSSLTPLIQQQLLLQILILAFSLSMHCRNRQYWFRLNEQMKERCCYQFHFKQKGDENVNGCNTKKLLFSLHHLWILEHPLQIRSLRASRIAFRKLLSEGESSRWVWMKGDAEVTF